ncbi:hypothetical protein [Flavobacterium sp.]|uniref:hypothetical protein n=1 Tax=Flavobacterium sp. TaxID=239 RepID=UPI002610DE5F|nr:hypothetical protein [Flavobacterium sp.]
MKNFNNYIFKWMFLNSFFSFQFDKFFVICLFCNTKIKKQLLTTIVFLFFINLSSYSQISVTATSGTIGPSNYTTLKLAFDSVNSGIHKGSINIAVTGNTTETVTATLNASGSGSALYSSIQIIPSGGVLRTISGSIAAGSPLINFNGADNVTINGLNTTGNALQLINNTVSATIATSTIRFIGDASNNIISNCTISGSSTSASSGTILFSTGTVTGNDFNQISNCIINPAGTNLPTNAIYSAGTSLTIDNSDNSILNCIIQDYFNSTVSSTGIYIFSNSTSWTISNNKFIQTSTRTSNANALTHRGIRITTPGGGNYNITNNIVGYANSSGTGNTIYNGNFATSFRGIELTSGSQVSNLQGNIISGINFSTTSGTTSSPGVFTGISVLSGTVNLGTTSGNIIGSNTLNSAIVINSISTNATRIEGIYVSTTTSSTIQNNLIGGISTSGSSANGYSIIGIFSSGTLGNFIINSNTIGSQTTPNSITAGTLGTTTTGVCSFYGICNTATGSISITNNAILNNSVYGTSTSLYYGIFNSGGIGFPVAIDSNVIDGAFLSGSGVIRGLYNSIAASSLSISNNILRNFTISSTNANLTAILNAGAVSSNITINSNKLGDSTAELANYTAASTSTFFGIYNTSGTSLTSLNIQGNDIRGISNLVLSSSVYNFISNTFATKSQNISNNSFTNLSIATTGNITFISNSVALPNLGSQIVSNNSIVGSFLKNGSGGTVTIFLSAATSNSTATIVNNNNNFSNISVIGTTILSGWNQRDLGLTSKTITGNVFNNLSSVSGAITAMSLNGFGSTSSVSNNTISNLAGQAAITGVIIGSTGNSSLFTINSNTITGLNSSIVGANVIGIANSNSSNLINFSQNTINTLSSSGATATISGVQISGGAGNHLVSQNTIFAISSTGTTGPTINGLLISGGTLISISKNKIYNLSQNGTINGGVVNGISITGATSVTASNNLISDLKAQSSSSLHAIRGISVNSSTANASYNLYHNTIYINTTSTGTNFGTEALYHATNATSTSAKLLLKNNIFINTSTAKGTGKTMAYYRNNTAFTNYDLTSNSNLFYAGTPNASNLIYFDNTNNCQTLASFQSKVGPREINSVSENITFLSIVGSNSNFLKPDASFPTFIESSGTIISTIPDDFVGTIRQGGSGYIGTGTAPDIGAYENEGIQYRSAVIVSGALYGNGSYTTLGSAFIAINGGSQTSSDIIITVRGDTNEGNFSATLNQGLWNSLTIRPIGNRIITGAITAGNPLIRFNGADNVIIDGINDSNFSLTLSNTTSSSTSGTSTVFFTADASNNTITNCTILGSMTATLSTAGGVIHFGNGITTGNDNNTISYCSIGPSGINLPSRLIYSSGSTSSSTIANSGITISNCNLYDYFLSSGAAAIYAITGNTDWNINSNKIYQTTTQTFTSAATVYGIYFANSTYGNNTQITGNTIGYNNNTSTGTSTYLGSSVAGNFTGIYFQASSTATNLCAINSNTISNISLDSSTGNLVGIINATGTSSNAISINSNTLQNFTLSTSTGILSGVNWGAASTLNVIGNTITAFNRNVAGNLYGIYSTSAGINETISNNNINNLNCNSTTIGNIYGIYLATSTGVKIITNNIVSMLNGTGGSNLYGIRNNTGTTVTLSGNNVNNINSDGGINPTVIGINKTSTGSANIFKNKIYNLTSTATNPNVSGILSSGTASTTYIYNNLIGNLNANLSNATNPITGINISAGSSVNVYYNTVLLDAISSGAVFGCSSIFVNTAVTTTLRNNIFINRSTPNGSALAVAYRRSSTTLTSYSTSSNNNSFFGTSIYTDGTNTDNTLAAYKTRMVTRDGLSVSENTTFISTNGNSSQFLHINSSVPNSLNAGGVSIAGYTDDYDGNTRDTTSPDIGADEFDLIPVITAFNPTNYCASGTEIVTITGFNLNNGAVSVKFNGISATIISILPNTIIVSAPTGLTSGLITVTTSSGTANSPTTFTVTPIPVVGTISSDQLVCSGTTPSDISLTGSTGSIQWQSSNDGINFTDISGETTSVLLGSFIGNLTVTRYFRAIVANGVCPSVSSPIVTLNVLSTIWDGNSWSNGFPNGFTSVVFTGNYSQSGSFSACNLTVTNNATVVIQSGDTITLNGGVFVETGSNLTFNNNANLIQNSNTVNSGIVSVKRNSNPLMRLDYTLWASPVSGQQLQSFSAQTLSNRFYTYNSASDLYTVVASPSTTNFSIGSGYLIRVPNNHPLVPTVWTGIFSGVLNNGDVNVAVDTNTYNAVGNPYPSPINADDFILSNNLTEALYFWRKSNSSASTSYATYTLAGGVGTSSNIGDPLNLVPNGIIQIGQGFIAKSTSSQLSFNNSMRISNSADQFFKTNTLNRNRIWLNLTSSTSEIFCQTMIAYMPKATNGFDSSLDGKLFEESPTSLTSLINNELYSIQARPFPLDVNDVVPLGFKSANAGNYAISINNVDGYFLNTNQTIYLKDNLTNTIHNLSKSNYNFVTQAGTFNSRFEIVYKNSLSKVQPINNSENIVIYKQYHDIVINAGNIVIDQVQVYDTSGKLLIDKKNVQNTELRLTSGMLHEMLLFRITTLNKEVVYKKVIP